MATTTPKLGLILPAGQEKVSRQVINDNMVKIDQASLNRSEFVFNPEVMKEAISAITGVQSVDIFMNRAEDEAGGIPGESIMVFVHNGSAASIAQAIYDTNTSGLETAGSIVRTVEETEIRFSRPTLNIIYPTITIEADYAAPDVATLGTPIKTAVYNYINSLGLGGTLHTEHLKEAIKASVDATLAATFNISKVQISGDFGIMYDGVITPEWNAKYAVFTVDSVTVVSQVNPHSKAIATQRTAMSYLVNGNVSTEAIPAGAYFQLVNSLITGRSDGEYTASKAIPANTAIDSTYFNESAPITGGGLNALNSNIADLFANESHGSFTPVRNGAADVWTAPKDCIAFISACCAHNNGGLFENIEIRMVRNGVSTSLANGSSGSGTAGSMFGSVSISCIHKLKAGDVIQIFTGFANNALPGPSYYAISY
jgi:hypothetical protein